MLKLKLQYFGHLMQMSDSFENTLMLGNIKSMRRRGPQRMRWLDGIIGSMDRSLGKSGHYPGDSGRQRSLEATVHEVAESDPT